MKIYAPDYYKDFKCLAGDCLHSCCIGWEVDIDSDTLEYYKTVEGEMGEKLKNAISYDGTPHFKMAEADRCPFLNSCGLCDIMAQLGFDKVSDICDDHPRFYNFYSDRKEIGLGLSCEAVAQMLVEKKDKTTLITIEDGQEILWEDECDFLDFRDDVFDILHNRQKPVANRLNEMLEYCGSALPAKSLDRWADIYLELERLDEAWADRLNSLKTTKPQQVEDSWFETALERLAVYFVYRHFTDGFDNENLQGTAAFCALSVYIIGALCGVHQAESGKITPQDMAEIIRMYSGEIEYSDENVQKLIDICR